MLGTTVPAHYQSTPEGMGPLQRLRTWAARPDDVA